MEEGRGRLTLIANEVARLAGTILTEYAAAARKLKDTKNAPDATADVAQQLQRLMPGSSLPRPLGATGAFSALPQRPITLRLDKYRADPARDAACWPNCARKSSATGAWWPSAGRGGRPHAELRWLLEELRVSFSRKSCARPSQ